MQAQKYTVPGFGVSVYESRAAFSANAQPLSSYHFMGTIYTNTGINAGVLKLNSTSLKYDLTTQYQENRYVDTVSTRNYSAGVTWSLSANASFSSFNTTVSRGFPNISNTNFLPASISKSAGCTFTIGSGNYSNTDSLLVLIVGSSGFPVMKHLAGTATSVAFTANDLSILSAGSNYVMVFGVNYSNMTVSGKKYIFIMEHDISANVAVNP